MFDKIAAEFNKHVDIKVTGEQCLRKWKKLETKHKEIEDNNSQTGRAHKTWKFHKEMEQCIGDKATVRPTFTFDSGSSASSSARSHSPQTIDDSSDAENDSVDSEEVKGKTAVDPESKQGRQMKRKRKSHSSASEMLWCLREYGEKREKVEEKNLTLWRLCNKRKKKFLVSC